MNALLIKAAPYGIAVLLAGGLLLQHNATQRALGAAAIRDSISAVHIKALQQDSSELVAGLVRLREDSSASAARITALRSDSVKLFTASNRLRADFQRELARWQSMVSGATDSTSDLAAIIGQANATIASCQADKANCEQRAANAEQKAAEADSGKRNAEARRLSTDSLWRNAESRATEYKTQADNYKKMVPSGFTSGARTVRDMSIGVGLKWLYDLISKPR